MKTITFMVQGSAIEPYEVTFVLSSDSNLSAYCTCPAGMNGQYCKHRFAILDGNPKAIVSNNPDDVQIVQSWLPGTDIEATMLKMRKLEKEASRIKKALSDAKKEVAKAMRC